MPIPSNLSPFRLARAAIDWLCEGRADYRTFRERQGTRGYRRKRGWCTWIWIGAGLAMIVFPGVETIVVVTLATTLVCFMLLDAVD